MLNIHRILLRRMIAIWFVVSVVIGGGMYWNGLEQIDDQIVGLAVAEARKISENHLTALNDPQVTSDQFEHMVDALLSGPFAVVEIYNRQHKKLAEKVEHGQDAIEKALKQYAHHFPQDDQPHYQRFSLSANTILQVMVPLLQNGSTVGYLEGVFLIDAETIHHLHDDLITSLLTMLAAVMLTMVVIYPVVRALNGDVIKQSRELLRGNIELMEVLGSAIAKRDSDTNAHNYRVSIYAVRLGEAVGVGGEQMRDLIAGAFLHDVGKIGISDSILLKPGLLDESEFATMKRHVAYGVDILRKSDWLQRARDVVEFHHEKYDGNGYLKGLKGDAIPLNARIFAIVDVFDALTSQRPYKKAMPLREALGIVVGSAGTHFDPQLVKAFAAIIPTLFEEISRVGDEGVETILRAIIARYFLEAAGAA